MIRKPDLQKENSRRPITAEILQKTVSKAGVEIPEHLVQDFTVTLAGARQDMETVMAMDGESGPYTFCRSCNTDL